MTPNPALLTWPRPAAGSSVILVDTFTRSNGPLRGTDADTGQTWFGANDTVAISSGAVTPTASGDNWACVDVGVADFIARIDYTRFNNTGAFLIRSGSDSSFKNTLAVAALHNAVQLNSKATGAFSILATHSMTWGGPTRTLEVICEGTSITINVDGSTVITHTTSNWQSNTQVGVYGFNAGGATFDNLEVEAI